MSSKQFSPRLLPEPDMPVMMTRRLNFMSASDRTVSEPRLEPARQLPRRVVTAGLQQMVARRHLDQHREMSPGRHRHLDERHVDSEDLVGALVEPEALVLLAL